mgnify:FL=1
MARLIQSSGYDQALIGGFVASEETRRRKDRDREVFREKLSRHRGHEYLERFDDRKRSLDLDLLSRRAMAINRKSRSAFRDDMIMELHETGDFQHSSRRMQDYLLADRRISYLARHQRIEGWQRPLEDIIEDIHSRHNPYYRAVHDGMMQASIDDDRDMVVTNYLCNDDHEKLDYHEKTAIMRARDRILELFNEGEEDPTSIMNNLL